MQQDLCETLESRVERQMLEWKFDRENVHTHSFACGLKHKGDVRQANDDTNTSEGSQAQTGSNARGCLSIASIHGVRVQV